MSQQRPPSCRELGIPDNVRDWTAADKAKFNAGTHAWLDAQNEPPADGVAVVDLTAGSPTYGKATIHSRQDIDRRRALPMTHIRTRTRARSALRPGRPSCTRRSSSSRASASSGTDPSDDPEPGEARQLSLLAGHDRRLADSLSRIGAVVA
jgi:hypothetical protein